MVVDRKTACTYLSKPADMNRLVFFTPDMWSQLNLGKDDPATQFLAGNGLYLYDDPSVQCSADALFRTEVEKALEGTHLHVMTHNARLEAFFKQKKEEGRRMHVIALNEAVPETEENSSAIVQRFVDFFGIAEKLDNCSNLSLIIPPLFASLPPRLQKQFYSLILCAMLDSSRRVPPSCVTSVHFLVPNDEGVRVLSELFDTWTNVTLNVHSNFWDTP